MREVAKWSHDVIEFDKDVPGDGEGHGWIQWKGTDVCMDVHCRCGAHGHIDDMFAYFYKCAKCGDTFCVGQVVRLYPIAKDKVNEIASPGCTKTDPTVAMSDEEAFANGVRR